ncbi:MAG: AbrB/MazE/SpoVT family DNA-binding domain-containing protein, partial [Anaerovoracaceae bacterium]|nr:AbrB/MazE/SpoVT family DNA-binding domain-containing protein [Anaerovoracaceae bacterium]
VGDKGQIVIPAKARKIFEISPGDQLVVLGDERQGLAIMKSESILAFGRCSQERNSRTGIDNEAMDMFLTAFM